MFWQNQTPVAANIDYDPVHYSIGMVDIFHLYDVPDDGRLICGLDIIFFIMVDFSGLVYFLSCWDFR